MRRGSRVINKKSKIVGTIADYKNYELSVRYDDGTVEKTKDVSMLIEINDFIADFVVGNKIFDPIFGVGKIIEKQTFQEKTTDEKEYLYNIVFSDGDKGSKEFLIPLFEDVNYIVI